MPGTDAEHPASRDTGAIPGKEHMMPSKLHVYEIPPIDFWSGWIDLEAMKPRLFASGYEDSMKFEKEVYELLDRAKDAALEAGWEGDMRDGPFMAALPGDVHSKLMFAWKQDNNGTTYVVSQEPLAWLEPHAFTTA